MLIVLLLTFSGAIRAEAELQCPLRPPDKPAPIATVSHPRGLLWEIKRADARPSYIYGTIHISDEDVLKLAPPVERALDHADSFVMEALFDEQAASAFTHLMYTDDNTRLEKQAGLALFKRASTLLEQYGIIGLAARRMKPWAAFLMLSQPAGEQGVPLDLALMTRASSHGAQVYGLESIQEQADVFGAMPLSDQLTLLRDTVCGYDEVQQELSRLKALYLARDLAGIKAMEINFEQDNDELSRKVARRLITERNRRMVRRLRPRLNEGNTFIAIGALHLPGDDGVLRLLERQGYTVTPLY
ncbi:MAG TPA: TraB/GumN family protein [Gammaproteobacteria bacterium]|nr:TraB/GumN family protein [Gammaproteobacteria bacterium]